MEGPSEELLYEECERCGNSIMVETPMAVECPECGLTIVEQNEVMVYH